MRWPLLCPFMRWVCGALFLLALAAHTNQAAAQPDDDSDDDGGAIHAIAGGPVAIMPGDEIENLFALMIRLDRRGNCPQGGGTPLLADPEPAEGSWGCVRFVNPTERPGIWRIDFEGSFGAAYVFRTLRGARTTTVLTNYPASGIADRETGGRRLASLPVVIAPGETVELRVRVETPDDLADADPVFRPENRFDDILQIRAHGFGALLGASTLLILFYVSFGRLLHSAPARLFGLYFAAMTLAVASNEGYFGFLFPADTILIVGGLDKILEAAQIALHVAFVAAFVHQSVPGHWFPPLARRFAAAAFACLLGAAVLSYALGGIDGALRYHDLDFELDPLVEDPAANLPEFIAAGVIVLWFASVLAASGLLLRRRTDGSVPFALGSVTLIAAMLGNSFSDLLFDDLSDDSFWLQYVILFDGLLFAAAMIRQAFGLRDQRDAALRQELVATREQVRLSETLLAARADRDRARGLAERHRSRLALTSHDLNQPLTSLRLAVTEAETAAPELHARLRSSVDYLASVLKDALVDARPEAIGAGHGPAPETEAVPLSVILTNVARMFADEAADNGLSLRIAPTTAQALVPPVALIRMVSNLVSNAIRYTERGGVVVGIRHRANGLAVAVCDTGPGLTADQIAAIRQSYNRGAEAGRSTGEGIGLSSIDALAREHGLRLEIDSRPGSGSCFAIAGLVPVPA